MDDSITLANRNEVASFNIIGAGNSGIAGAGVTGFNIHDVNITQSQGPGIRINDPFGNGSIRAVTVTQNSIAPVNPIFPTPTGGIVITSSTSQAVIDLRCITAVNNNGPGVNLVTTGGSLIVSSLLGNYNNNSAFGFTADAQSGSIELTSRNDTFNQNAACGAGMLAGGGAITATFFNGTFIGNTGALVSPATGLRLVGGTVNPSASGTLAVTTIGGTFSLNQANGIGATLINSSVMDLAVFNANVTQNLLEGIAIDNANTSTARVSISGSDL